MSNAQDNYFDRVITRQQDEIERLRAALMSEPLKWENRVYMPEEEYRAIRAEIERLRALLKECADDLEAAIEAHYRNTKDHPAMQWRYERDMEPVTRAREILGQKEAGDER